MPLPITDIERKILDFMVQYLRENTYQPSIREIGERFGIKSTKTVSEHLQALAEKGFLERDPSRSRGVRILGVDLHADTVSIPCFRDFPDDRRAEPAETFLTLDRRLAGPKGGFFVRAHGGAGGALGVQDGDYLLMEPVAPEELEEGAVVVVRTGGRTAFRRVDQNGSGVRLVPLPPGGGEGAVALQDLSRNALVGRVAALYRRMDGVAAPTSLATH
jgi:repressor LexA